MMFRALAVTFLGAAVCVGQETVQSHNVPLIGEPPPKIVGPEHREIADSSPVAMAIIKQVEPNPQGKAKLAVDFTMRNLTDHELVYVDTSGAFDVRSSATGERAPETPAGCRANFFSSCHTSFVKRHSPITLRIPAHGSVDLGISYVDPEYLLKPENYSVVAYFCAKEREGPECFKSNTLTVIIPSEPK